MHMYEGYHFGGMHFFWWFIWALMLVWIFAVPYNIPGQRTKRDSPIDHLKRRLAIGEISNSEYLEKKSLLENI
jgi:putative membrane protein